MPNSPPVGLMYGKYGCSVSTPWSCFPGLVCPARRLGKCANVEVITGRAVNADVVLPVMLFSHNVDIQTSLGEAFFMQSNNFRIQQ